MGLSVTAELKTMTQCSSLREALFEVSSQGRTAPAFPYTSVRFTGRQGGKKTTTYKPIISSKETTVTGTNIRRIRPAAALLTWAYWNSQLIPCERLRVIDKQPPRKVYDLEWAAAETDAAVQQVSGKYDDDDCAVWRTVKFSSKPPRNKSQAQEMIMQSSQAQGSCLHMESWPPSRGTGVPTGKNKNKAEEINYRSPYLLYFTSLNNSIMKIHSTLAKQKETKQIRQIRCHYRSQPHTDSGNTGKICKHLTLQCRYTVHIRCIYG